MSAVQKRKKGRVVTLETFIIDTFTRVDERGIEHSVDQDDQIGGGGTYAIIGSRIFLPPERLGMIVHHTPSSLPHLMRDELLAYGSGMWDFSIRTDGYATTRSVNRYTGNLRMFEYLTPPRYITPTDLLSTPWTDPPPSTIHIISEIERIRGWLPELKEVRQKLGREGKRWEPRIVWEPEPYDCVPSHLEAFASLVPKVDIFRQVPPGSCLRVNPNHTEALGLLFLPSPSPDEPLPSLRERISSACRSLSQLGAREGTIIRSGEMGCCYLPHGDREVRWIPPFHSARDDVRVVDPTGAGNGFMGAVAAALDEGKDLHEAVLWGTVAASFMIEQHGLPKVSMAAGRELWNGEDPRERVEAMRARLQG